MVTVDMHESKVGVSCVTTFFVVFKSIYIKCTKNIYIIFNTSKSYLIYFYTSLYNTLYIESFIFYILSFKII